MWERVVGRLNGSMKYSSTDNEPDIMRCAPYVSDIVFDSEVLFFILVAASKGSTAPQTSTSKRYEEGVKKIGALRQTKASYPISNGSSTHRMIRAAATLGVTSDSAF